MYTGISIALIVFGLIWFVLCLFPTLMIAISMIGSPERYNNVSIGWSTWLSPLMIAGGIFLFCFKHGMV